MKVNVSKISYFFISHFVFGLNIRSIVLACCFLLLPPARRVVAVVIVGIERFPFIVVVVEIIERKNNLAHLLVMTAFRHAINLKI